MFRNQYKGRRVLVTGHTGFKGSWLVLWLTRLGAEVTGYSLPPPTVPNHIDHLQLNIASIENDIRDIDKLKDTLVEYKPEIIFHLAAQSLVRQSYREPVDTFTTNSLGTMNVLEACRLSASVKAIIIITSDKCYKNREWPWGYRENDAIGGYDPYSASKACVELIVSCWRDSYFNLTDYGKSHSTLLASARAGNVIGGGDWANDRILPDLIRAARKNEAVLIRNPSAVRPWQHVLEPLSGYLLLGQKLLEGKKEFSGPWNFGPSSQDSVITVSQLAHSVKKIWPLVVYKEESVGNGPHETGFLRLDISKAQSKLNWNSVWDINTTIDRTVGWYRSYCEKEIINTVGDLQAFETDAKANSYEWAIE